MEVLRYAHENGCLWDEETCAAAAEGGHLNVLKYARKNGCPWNKEACLQSIRLGETHSCLGGQCEDTKWRDTKSWVLSQPAFLHDGDWEGNDSDSEWDDWDSDGNSFEIGEDVD